MFQYLNIRYRAPHTAGTLLPQLILWLYKGNSKILLWSPSQTLRLYWTSQTHSRVVFDRGNPYHGIKINFYTPHALEYALFAKPAYLQIFVLSPLFDI